MTNAPKRDTTGQRGGAGHGIREQIVVAAEEHFAHYGYGKTTVADLAKAIGFSKAYIYKFFDSKQAIGEAICAQCIGRILAATAAAVDSAPTATEKLRMFFRTLIETNIELLFDDRKLYDMAAVATTEKWPTVEAHLTKLNAMLLRIILLGRETGEFERKTPVDETCRAIIQAMQPFIDPVMLERNLDRVPNAPQEVTNLILRSLAP